MVKVYVVPIHLIILLCVFIIYVLIILTLHAKWPNIAAFLNNYYLKTTSFTKSTIQESVYVHKNQTRRSGTTICSLGEWNLELAT